MILEFPSTGASRGERSASSLLGSAEAKTARKRSYEPQAAAARKRILLVDDDDLVRSVIADALRHEGFLVIEAASGPAALSLSGSLPPFDLVVSDVVMPVMPGPSMVARMRATRPGLKVLFITGHAGHHDLRGERVLHKPFTNAALRDASLEALSS